MRNAVKCPRYQLQPRGAFIVVGESGSHVLGHQMTKPTSLIEAFDFSGTTVDRENSVIKGVKVLGKQSRNGRIYEDAAIQDSAVCVRICPLLSAVVMTEMSEIIIPKTDNSGTAEQEVWFGQGCQYL